MFSRSDIFTIAFPVFLFFILIILHSAELNVGFHLRGFDWGHEFWGGVAVEMLGVAIEIALIIGILTAANERRWGPIRKRIAAKLQAAVSTELRYAKDYFESENNPVGVILSIETYKNVHEGAADRATKTADFLQFVNNGFSPEMSEAVALFMSEYTTFGAGAQLNVSLNPAHMSLPQDEKEPARRRQLFVQLKWMQEALAPIIPEGMHEAHLREIQREIDSFPEPVLLRPLQAPS